MLGVRRKGRVRMRSSFCRASPRFRMRAALRSHRASRGLREEGVAVRPVAGTEARLRLFINRQTPRADRTVWSTATCPIKALPVPASCLTIVRADNRRSSSRSCAAREETARYTEALNHADRCGIYRE